MRITHVARVSLVILSLTRNRRDSFAPFDIQFANSIVTIIFFPFVARFLGVIFIEDKKIKRDASVEHFIIDSKYEEFFSSRDSNSIREFGLNVGFNLIMISFLPFPLSVRFSSTFENHARSIIIPSLRSSQQEEFFWNSITLISQIYLDNDNDTFPSFYRSFLEHFRESRAFVIPSLYSSQRKEFFRSSNSITPISNLT